MLLASVSTSFTNQVASHGAYAVFGSYFYQTVRGLTAKQAGAYIGGMTFAAGLIGIAFGLIVFGVVEHVLCQRPLDLQTRRIPGRTHQFAAAPNITSLRHSVAPPLRWSAVRLLTGNGSRKSSGKRSVSRKHKQRALPL